MPRMEKNERSCSKTCRNFIAHKTEVMMEEKISIVIPCYRSEKIISSVVEEIISVLSNLPYEIILVCDGSPDNVWAEIKNLHSGHECVHGILLSRNFGQHSATLAGYRVATGDIIITMDDDGQCDPSAILRMIDKINDGYDVVYAKYPFFKKSNFRIFGSWINRKMAEILTGKPPGIQTNSFFSMKRFVMDEIIRYKNSFPYLGGLVFRTTNNITEIIVSQRKRQEGISSYTLPKLVKLWINGFTAFSILPLRIASLLGVAFSLTGFILGTITIIEKILNPDILMGYTSLMVTILFIGGVILLALGMIGEYIGRIYISQNQAPQYVVKEFTERRN